MILSNNDPHYPVLLKEIHNSPPRLHLEGDTEILRNPCIAIVGTRKNTEYGEYVTQKIIRELASFEVNIVSGLALGIDTIAHEEALKNSLKTIAILGSGLKNVYPRANLALAQKIAQEGLLISEYEDSDDALEFHFPQRNRIISGLSLATVVIEAGEKSGAMITARLALDQGREIFVVPGDIDREKSAGALKLLQIGAAYPISSGREIIEVLRAESKLFKEKNPPPETQIKAKLSMEEEIIFDLIPKARGVTLEKLAENSKLKIDQILTALSCLEIKGFIKNGNGKFSRQRW